jgi:hypothetical protein
MVAENSYQLRKQQTAVLQAWLSYYSILWCSFDAKKVTLAAYELNEKEFIHCF